MTTLSVWWNARRVGTVTETATGDLRFRYFGFESPRISVSLPVDPAVEYPSTFFDNLLPEGDARLRLARRLGVSDSRAFALLAAVGGDCAGALSLHPGEVPAPAGLPRLLLLTDAMLSLALRSGSATVLLDSGMRLSLAGAQDKLPVVRDGSALHLPDGAAASTHILKLPTTHFAQVASNEWLTMELGRRCGLAVAPAELWPLPMGREPGLLVERFDRKSGQRIHQEDFCQALGLSPNRKYEEDGGPTLAAIGAVLHAHSTAPADDIARLLQWVAFGLLVGNADGHAKNLALLYDIHGRIELAPFYDLLCTRQWRQLATRSAFAIGGATDPGSAVRKHWRALAAQCQVGGGWLERLVLDLVERVEAQWPVLAAQVGQTVARGAVLAVERTVRERVRRVRAGLVHRA